jgi:hypothetical protein
LSVSSSGKEWATVRRGLVEGGSLVLTAERPRGFAAKTAEGYPLLVEHAPGHRVDWVVVRVPVCKQAEMDPELVLERNGTLAFATLLLMQGAYWLRVAVPFDSSELDNPAELVSLCIDAARSLNPHRGEVVTGASDIFSHYAE